MKWVYELRMYKISESNKKQLGPIYTLESLYDVGKTIGVVKEVLRGFEIEDELMFDISSVYRFVDEDFEL